MSNGAARRNEQHKPPAVDERRELAKAIYVELIAKNNSFAYLSESWAQKSWAAADAFFAAEPEPVDVNRGPGIR